MRLEAQGISRDYYRNGKDTNVFCAVQPTDFVLEEGHLTEIIGRSGSGKTTFTNMLCGLLEPTRGRVLLGEEELYALDDTARSMLRNRTIGIIPQGQTGLQSLTVLENVLLPAIMYPAAEDVAAEDAAADGASSGGGETKEERAHRLLELVGIEDLCNVYSNELSGGELRRLAIARALINEPEILIADEPTGDLDDETTRMVLDLLREYADKGASVLMVTHEKEAMAYADSIWRMDKGVLRPYSE